MGLYNYMEIVTIWPTLKPFKGVFDKYTQALGNIDPNTNVWKGRQDGPKWDIRIVGLTKETSRLVPLGFPSELFNKLFFGIHTDDEIKQAVRDTTNNAIAYFKGRERDTLSEHDIKCYVFKVDTDSGVHVQGIIGVLSSWENLKKSNLDGTSSFVSGSSYTFD